MRTAALSDISDSIEYGVTASAASEPVGPKFLRITDIQNGSVDWSTVPFCAVDERKLTSARLQPGDIVFARTGATTGKSFLIRKCPEHAVFASYLIRVRPSKEVNPAYLAHFFDSPNYWGQIALKAAGAAQPGVNSSKLKELEIPLPPLKVQKRIAAILDQADVLRRLRQRALDKLNTLGQSIFYEMFGDPDIDGFDRLGNYASKIGSGATPKGGNATYKESGTPFVRSMNVRDGHFTQSGLAYIDEKQARKLDNVVIQERDVLLNITGASVARVCLAPDFVASGRVNQHVSIIRTDERVRPEFLEAFLLFPNTKRKLLAIAEAGATRQAITKTQIEELLIPVPAISDQNKFVNRRNIVVNSQSFLQDHLNSIETLFSSLQQRAFRGEL